MTHVRIPCIAAAFAASACSDTNLGDGGSRVNLVRTKYGIQTMPRDATPCPDVFAFLTYCQSTDLASPHYAYMTSGYAAEERDDLPFCADDVETKQISETTLEP